MKDINTRDYDEIVKLLEIYKDDQNEFLLKRTTLLPNKIIKDYFELLTYEYLKTLSVDKIHACELDDVHIEKLYILDVLDIDYLIKNKNIELLKKIDNENEAKISEEESRYNQKLVSAMAFETEEITISKKEYLRKIWGNSNMGLVEHFIEDMYDHDKR